MACSGRDIIDLDGRVVGTDVDISVSKKRARDDANDEKDEMSGPFPTPTIGIDKQFRAIGALDLMPKIVIDALSDWVEEETTAFSFWGAIVVKFKFPQDLVRCDKVLPKNVVIVDNLNDTTCVAVITDLAANGAQLPIAISHGPAPSVSSAAESMPSYHNLPWYHLCARGPARTILAKTIQELRDHDSIQEAHICAAVTNPHDVLYVALLPAGQD
ncbi:MAG: hypothetical protein WC763_06300 [Candidatus Paceibacterota bacterium]|jgi:hypothetical protein